MATFQVPQFIDIEDKILGPLSLRQFITLVATIGIVIFLYQIFQFFLWFILSVIIVGIGASLAFLKINGQNFSRVLANGFKYLISPRLYVWQRTGKKKVLTPKILTEPEEKQEEKKRLTLEQLEEYAEKLDK